MLVNIVLDAGTATGAAAAPVAVCKREKIEQYGYAIADDYTQKSRPNVKQTV